VAVATALHIRGSYFESCNCDPICPCRRIDGVPGGRSTHGICAGVLSWVIEEGAANEINLGGLAVALAIRYDGDERVTCVISGHDRGGEELVAEELRVDDGGLSFDYSGTCGYAATFDYSG